MLETARRVGLSVFGFQQLALWGWSNPAIWAAMAVGVILLVVFLAVEARTESPLINVRIFRNRTFLVENIVPGSAMMAFIPVFFFAAIYGQIALAQQATTASLLILYFLVGFVVCAQIGGRMLDRIGVKRPVVLGCVLTAVGFGLWAGKATDLQVGAQVSVIMAVAALVAVRVKRGVQEPNAAAGTEGAQDHSGDESDDLYPTFR